MNRGQNFQRPTFGAVLLAGALGLTPAGCSTTNAPGRDGALPDRAQAANRAGAPTAPAKLQKGFTVLYSFGGPPDGATPFAGVVVDKAGNIFGTTYAGGENSDGAVFELKPSGSGYAETVVHSFDVTDGSNPGGSPLVDGSGNVFATAIEGGAYSAGTAIKLSPSGDVYSLANAHSFGNGTDGSSPNAGAYEHDATLYTTTAAGGKYGAGAIVALGAAGLTETDVYDFKSGADGAYPLSNLVADASGALYGTTVAGGTASAGTVFKFVPAKGGGTETVLWSFQGKSQSDGASPNGGVVLDASGNLYGTTPAGGGTSNGIVYKLTPKKGAYVESILHTFSGGSDGSQPIAGLALSGKLLYGTTSSGSGSLCLTCGTLFRLATSGKAYEIVHTFEGSPDGANPLAALYVDGSALYGTTSNGGTSSLGTVFRLVP